MFRGQVHPTPQDKTETDIFKKQWNTEAEEEQWAWFGYVNHCNGRGLAEAACLLLENIYGVFILHLQLKRELTCEMEGERDLVKSDSMRGICSGKYSEKAIKFIESRCALVERMIMVLEMLCFRVIKNGPREVSRGCF